MAGNSQRRGAVRKAGSKKAPTKGSGGQRRRGLEGRGPTPKAEDREYHPAAKRAEASRRRASNDPKAQAALAADRAARLRTRIGIPADAELVVGRNPVAEAVRAGVTMSHVLISGAAASDERLAELVRTATALGAPLVESSRVELDLLTDGGVHQGVAIAVAPYAYADLADLLDRAERRGHAPLVVALDSVTDPHNLGAVLRSAAAFGADGVLLPERRSAGVTSTVWKVSAGAAARVPVARETNLTRALTEAKKAGCFVVGLDGEGTTSVRDLELATEPLVLVTGSEGKGLSRLVRETCDVVASIPIAEDVESLNAAVATGVALYEISRRRAEAGPAPAGQGA
ncbi:23S rRNA (guanosine(2251)-2'-O)-methyltransferase RlmB [Georgenia sp. Z1491]|uniref:23S rRNA (guanosine(2251)-2'-O)-methyltransferase RlmB n=1 Tax=Georgenia sp. Z1491 TaxID=3416707 RepID=UPI003CF9D3DD